MRLNPYFLNTGIKAVNATTMTARLLGVILCTGVIFFAKGTEAARVSSASSQPGQQLFTSNCAGCHGLDGRGGEHGPNIATTMEVQRLEDRDILHVIREGIAAGGMPAFRSFDNGQLNAILTYLRVLQGKHSDAKIAGDVDKGRSLFFGKARCSECHMIAGRGGFIAADLSGYGNQHSPDVIRNSILDPNKNLDPRDRTVVAVTSDGQTYTGIARNEDNFSLQLQTLDGAFHLVEKSTLTRLVHEPQSIMPSNYGSTLSRSELDDLISFLSITVTGKPQLKPEEEEEP